ncbi:hypothetical protein ACMHYB_16660 [Sorangium sp. So ce1128]
MRSRDVGLLGLGALCAVALSMGAVGCQPEGNSSLPTGPSGSGGTTGEGGSGAETSSGDGAGGGGGEAGTATTGSAGGGEGGGGTGDPPPPPARVATIEEITTGTVGEGVDVEVKGVVAMSHKFFVSKGGSGSCLWGVFLSSPGDGETEPYSGVLALSYGTMAVTQDNDESYCPKLGQEPVGDAFPDDIKPGDVLDVAGRTSSFLLDQCATQPAEVNPSEVKQRQLANVARATKIGETTPRSPHLLTAADAAKLSSPTDVEFHDMWGGVKVRLENVSPLATMPVVDTYGTLRLDMGDSPILEVRRNIYYRPYSQNFCHEHAQFESGVTFESIKGFSSISFCTWSLLPHDKCADFSPSSTDCGGATTCPPDTIQ